MRCVSSCAAFLVFVIVPSWSSAQIADFIIEVGDVEFDTQADVVWVNAAQCGAQGETALVVSLGTPVGGQQFVFAAGANINCQNDGVRNGDPPRCGEISGSPIRVESDNLISVPLDQLTATGFVDCENLAQEGTPYSLFDFRDDPPGSNDVGPEGYGVADFTVDVVGPLAVSGLDTTPRTGASFRLSWDRPVEIRIQEYQFLQNTVNDPGTATVISGVSAGQDATSATIRGSSLTLNDDDSAFLFVQAIDQAGNLGDVSAGVQVIVVPTEGFCDSTGECTGCRATRLSPSQTGSTWALLAILALLGLVCVRRLVR